jgi:hypothetical protein
VVCFEIASKCSLDAFLDLRSIFLDFINFTLVALTSSSFSPCALHVLLASSQDVRYSPWHHVTCTNISCYAQTPVLHPASILPPDSEVCLDFSPQRSVLLAHNFSATFTPRVSELTFKPASKKIEHNLLKNQIGA